MSFDEKRLEEIHLNQKEGCATGVDVDDLLSMVDDLREELRKSDNRHWNAEQDSARLTEELADVKLERDCVQRENDEWRKASGEIHTGQCILCGGELLGRFQSCNECGEQWIDADATERLDSWHKKVMKERDALRTVMVRAAADLRHGLTRPASAGIVSDVIRRLEQATTPGAT